MIGHDDSRLFPSFSTHFLLSPQKITCPIQTSQNVISRDLQLSLSQMSQLVASEDVSNFLEKSVDFLKKKARRRALSFPDSLEHVRYNKLIYNSLTKRSGSCSARTPTSPFTNVP